MPVPITPWSVAEVGTIERAYNDGYQAAKHEIDELNAENKRLRESLREIGRFYNWDSEMSVVSIARKALRIGLKRGADADVSIALHNSEIGFTKTTKDVER